MDNSTLIYGEAILSAYRHLLSTYPEVFVLGQGLWSPWYVGNSMTDLDKEFGKDRVIDTPVCEQTSTGVAVGASLCGYRPVVVHPRIDFMLYAMDAVVNEAAKWSHMLGGQAHPAVTIRGIVNRGGEQGAQHSQSLHAWFAHIPGLRVVMPATAQDARDLLIASVLCDDPVVYIDDRWLYELQQDFIPIQKMVLSEEGPKVIQEGNDITLVGSSYSTHLCQQVAQELIQYGFSADVVDLRVISPLKVESIVASVEKTKRLYVVDGGWSACGLAGEVIAGVVEQIELSSLKASPRRMTLPPAPAPTSKPLEKAYYPSVERITQEVLALLKKEK